ncbi:MAG: ABC transporter permease [Spirochaetales bacterium]|nr:ABC transporter permease [Spirochaetales bacterium]
MEKLITGLKVTLGIVGVVFWAASQFWGVLLVLLAMGLQIFQNFRSMDRNEALKKLKQMGMSAFYPAVGILAALLIGGIIMALSGYDPVRAYGAMFYGGLIKNWHISLLNATPLIFTGLSIAVAFRAGLFNIGAEGQYYVGSMVATWLAIRFSLPLGLYILVIFVLAGTAAAAYNIIPTWLKIRTGAHEVVTTMMFAHMARIFSTIFVRNNGGDPATSTHAYVTDAIQEANELLPLKSLISGANYRVHIGVLLALAVAVFIWYLLYKTRIGYEIRAVGENQTAAKTQGINAGRTIMIAMLIAGFLCGMSGTTQVLGLEHKMYENLNAGYGWNGISVALLAGNDPIGVIFAALLWGLLDAGGQYMARTTQTPSAIVEIIKGIILFLILAKYLYFWFGQKLIKGRKKMIAREAT